jgi:intraflagellar transport protein 140
LDVLVAIATDNNQINFYIDEATLLPSCIVTRKVNVSCMKWQSSARILATGWEDGHISVFDINDKRLDCVYSNDMAHGSGGRGVRFLLWNPACTRLVTGDGEGTVRVWKSDNRGLLNTFKQYGTGPSSVVSTSRSPCTTAVFSTSNLDKAGAFLGSNFSPSFFFGSEEGNVFFADDLGHSAQVQSLSSCVDELLFYDDRRRLIILTRSLLLVQLQVDDDGRVVPVQKVKLSVGAGSGERAIHQVIWAGPGLIAAASGESVVRFWNLANDDNYTLSLQKPISRSDRVLSLGFNHHQRFLAIGTKEGKVAMYRYVGGDGSDDGANDWEVMTPTAVAWKSPVKVLSWGPERGLFGCGGALGSSVMREDVLHRVMSGNVAALQLTSQLVRIDRRQPHGDSAKSDEPVKPLGSNAFIVRAAMNVRGVAVSETHLAVWNGTQAQIFELGETTAEQVTVQHTTAKV